MDKAELDQKFAFLKGEPKPEAFIYAVSEGSSPKQFNVLQQYQVDFVDMFTASINEYFIQKEAYNVENYSTAESRQDTYYIYDLLFEKDQPDEIKYIRSIINIDANDKYGNDGKTLADITGLFIRITNGDESITIFKSISNVEKTYAKKGLKLMHFGDNQYKRLEDDLLNVSPDFEIVYVGGDIIFTNISKLEKKPAYIKVIQNVARKGIKAIGDLGLIEDMNTITELCSKPSYAKRLLDAVSNSEVIKQLNTGEKTKTDVIHYVSGRKDFHIKTNKGRTKLLIKSAESARMLLKLLSDDFLISEFTGANYDAESKKIIEKK